MCKCNKNVETDNNTSEENNTSEDNKQPSSPVSYDNSVNFFESTVSTESFKPPRNKNN